MDVSKSQVATQMLVRTRWNLMGARYGLQCEPLVVPGPGSRGSGAIHTPGADLRHILLVESLVGHIMRPFPNLVHLAVLGHAVVGLQWPFGSWNSPSADTNSQLSTNGKRAHDDLEPGPILTPHGCSADIAELLPAEIDAVIQNMGQCCTHHHFTQHNRTCLLTFRNTRVVY